MCKLKSGIILKDRVYVGETDSHTELLKELGIEDTFENASKIFVRAELIPTDNDVFSNIDSWEYSVDQDILPDWYMKDFDRERMVEAVKEWANNHVHVNKVGLHLKSGKQHYIKDCEQVVIDGSAEVECIRKNSKIEKISGNATVELISGNANVEEIGGKAKVEKINGDAKVELISGNATVEEISENAKVGWISKLAKVNGK